jgi:phosphatidylglycerophosphatase A
MNMEIKQAGPVKRAITFAATGFGLGYSPFAPGTVGSLWGVAIVFGMTALDLSVGRFIAMSVGLTLIAIPLCGVAEQVFQKKDDSRIVADEYMTFPICMIGLPVSWEYWWVLPMAFCSNRFFDILKLPPARQFERIPGGAGITLDDAAASVYSLGANWAVFWVATTWLGL